ncbi:metallophosphoesterase [Octadecabacter sp. G9-8]|uniref:Metallophosphoesterase n=1 Tax=Octadecabacter dasysiphoniae TaxID=2909341 RepID=A0ABS9CU32_9RHOB|nr:metallophosphoesterase [Octadecabacter dasysiphoniae]MCF2870747.1 metallophosphoesterase [Octadecabacter dasysiphoniae]
MTKLIWMSDPHYTQEGRVLGHDPRARLDAAIDHINTHHSDASMCLITGDMVNRGTHEDYAGLRKKLDTLSMPYCPMAGNHDNRTLFKQSFELPETCMQDFIQYTIRTPQGLIVCLDTHKTGSDAGEFCQNRSAWLTKTLRDAGTTPVFLFLHHPPIALGLPMQDTENMENGQAFVDLISGFTCVKYVFMGHVHRPITGTIDHIPFATMRSVLYQAPPPRPEWTWKTFTPSAEAPCIGVIQIVNSSVIMQYDQFCPYETGVLSG